MFPKEFEGVRSCGRIGGFMGANASKGGVGTVSRARLTARSMCEFMNRYECASVDENLFFSGIGQSVAVSCRIYVRRVRGCTGFSAQSSCKSSEQIICQVLSLLFSHTSSSTAQKISHTQAPSVSFEGYLEKKMWWMGAMVKEKQECLCAVNIDYVKVILQCLDADADGELSVEDIAVSLSLLSTPNINDVMQLVQSFKLPENPVTVK